MGRPDWPQFLKSILAPRRSSLVTSVNWAGILPKDSGMRWPASWLRTGFGSKVSIWLGPPAIMRKMTDLAFAGKCGGLAASGLSLEEGFGGRLSPEIAWA